jgi:hypothetical protein
MSLKRNLGIQRMTFCEKLFQVAKKSTKRGFSVGNNVLFEELQETKQFENNNRNKENKQQIRTEEKTSMSYALFSLMSLPL